MHVRGFARFREFGFRLYPRRVAAKLGQLPGKAPRRRRIGVLWDGTCILLWWSVLDGAQRVRVRPFLIMIRVTWTGLTQRFLFV